MIRILLVDDHQIILDSLSFMFSSLPNIEIVGAVSECKNVFQFLENDPPDIVISDFNMPKMSGVDLTLHIKEKFHNVKVLLLTMVEDAPNIREAIKAGVDGYVLKKAGKDELEKAIRSIYAGKKFFSESVIDELAASAGNDLNLTNPQTIHHLTSREIEILRLIAKELPSNQIAEKLFISMATVETHRRNLMQKLGVKTSIGMVKYAWKHGLVNE
jgi:DNA-binding NarL/FixJ family response regulator